MSTVHGIDLGSSTTIVAGVDDAGNPVVIPNPRGDLSTPSAVLFNEEGTTVVGQEALHRGLVDPDRFVADAKRLIGTNDVACTVDGRSYFAWEIQAILLEDAAHTIEVATGERPHKVAVSVPANYRDHQKDEVMRAAERAGLDVVVLPHEPSAALIGSGAHRRGDGLRLVIDVGGCTTDTSLGQVKGNRIEILVTNGIPALGGQDFNARLRDWGLECCERVTGSRPVPEDDPTLLYDLEQRIEQVKQTLSVKDSASLVLRCGGGVVNETITRDAYESMTRSLVDEVMDCAETTLRETGRVPEDVCEFILVGGQCQAPAFAAAVEARFGRKPWAHGRPHHAVAEGNVLCARMELERQGSSVTVRGRRLPPLGLSAQEVTAHPVGVAALGENGCLVNSVILPKGTVIPSDRTERFRLAEPGQTEALLQLLQGSDGAVPDDCQKLGHFELTGAKAVADSEHPIDVRLHLDRNGILSASAHDPIGGATAEMTLDYGKGSNGKAPRAGKGP